MPKTCSLQGAKTDCRLRLIQAGLESLLRKGYTATSIHDVVDGAGVPKGSFYYYFKTKEDFVEAVLQEYTKQKAVLMQEYYGDTSISPLNRLRKHLAAGIRCMMADNYATGCLIGHIGQEIAASSPKLRKVLNEMTQAWQAAHLTIFQEAIVSGELPGNTNLEALVESYMMLMQGAIIEAKITKSLRGFQNAHWLIFKQIGTPAHLLDAETETLLAISALGVEVALV